MNTKIITKNDNTSRTPLSKIRQKALSNRKIMARDIKTETNSDSYFEVINNNFDDMSYAVHQAIQ